MLTLCKSSQDPTPSRDPGWDLPSRYHTSGSASERHDYFVYKTRWNPRHLASSVPVRSIFVLCVWVEHCDIIIIIYIFFHFLLVLVVAISWKSDQKALLQEQWYFWYFVLHDICSLARARKKVMSTILLALGALIAGYSLWSLRALQLNITEAKRSGIPYVVVPVYTFNTAWLITHRLWLRLISYLPPAWHENWSMWVLGRYCLDMAGIWSYV